MNTIVSLSLYTILCLFKTATSAPTEQPGDSSVRRDLCLSDSLLDEITKIVDNSSPGIKHLGDIPAYAAASCQQIAQFRDLNCKESGYYWIQDKTGPVRVYCHINCTDTFGEEGVWMRIADVNMAGTSSTCPSGLELVTSPKRLCRKRVDSGCSSATFATHNVPFTKVCGRVIGIQYSHVNAFDAYYGAQTRTIDDLYVDGVSITHNRNPRQHIWTFAAAQDEIPNNSIDSCPCANSKSHVAFTGLIPEFIGNDYYCETGSRISYSSRYYLEDPLWDGKGCGRFSTCCDGERKPWFCKDLGEPVTSDVEVRVCADEARSSGGEDVLIEVIELYIQ